jgi:hypothetical protein
LRVGDESAPATSAKKPKLVNPSANVALDPHDVNSGIIADDLRVTSQLELRPSAIAATQREKFFSLVGVAYRPYCKYRGGN